MSDNQSEFSCLKCGSIKVQRVKGSWKYWTMDRTCQHDWRLVGFLKKDKWVVVEPIVIEPIDSL